MNMNSVGSVWFGSPEYANGRKSSSISLVTVILHT